MMKSNLFTLETRRNIEKSILAVFNNQPDFLSATSVSSPRAVGDAVETIIGEHFREILGENCKEFSDKFARRAMADMAFYGMNDAYYIVDIKTHNLNTQFNMPNLTSVERLARFYEDDQNYFTLLMIKYHAVENKISFQDAHFVPIEFLSWECLTIGAFGWGQILIANANNIKIHENYSRKKWMLELCDALLLFYPKEIEKIGKRISHFEQIRSYWETKEDNLKDE